MTIAAGIQFNGGVLLCADTQFSSPSIKFFDSKIMHYEAYDEDDRQVNTVVAMSGTDGYMQMIVRKVEDAVSSAYTAEAEEWDSVIPKDVIESALIEAYNKHVYPHPRYGYVGGPNAELLIGMWQDSENAKLYRTYETSVNEVSYYNPCVFVGSGSDVARYAIAPLIDPGKFRNEGISLDEAVLLATHALRVAKQNDIYCGGRSEFAVLYDDGSTGGVANYAINATEKYSETFEMILRRLFYSLADLKSERTQEAIRLSNAQLAQIRREQKLLIAERKQIVELLKSSGQSANKE